MDADDPRKEPEVDTLFAMRMRRACDANDLIPDEGGGRLVWIHEQMRKEGMDVALQSVHRWYHGRARPRRQKLLMLAKVLQVDESWLDLGRMDEIVSRRSKPQRPVLDGAVYVVMGLMRLAGISCAWPDDDEPAGYVHFYSIIRGKQHRVHVAYIQDEGESGEVLVHLPVEYEKCSIVACRRKDDRSVDLWHIPGEQIRSHSDKRGGFVEISCRVEGTVLRIGDSSLKAISKLESVFP